MTDPTILAIFERRREDALQAYMQAQRAARAAQANLEMANAALLDYKHAHQIQEVIHAF